MANELHPDFLNFLAGHPEFDGLEEALTRTPPPVSVRLNAAKGMAPGAGADTVSWCPQGIYLPERPQFTLDPRMHQGLYYVQDASSMVFSRIAARLTADGQPVRWLDACAAPGGKTTAVADALPDGSLVVANEFDPRRCGALVENMERWGCPRTMVTRGDTAAFRNLPGFFDVVAVDAPCSGEGMMRKEPEAVRQWSPGLIRQCASLQRQILENVWPALRPGGFLVYSTCTFNTAEDEDNVAWLAENLGAVPVDVGLSLPPEVVDDITGRSLPVFRFLPGRVRGEGLFVAVLRKDGDSSAAPAPLPRKFRGEKLPPWLVGDFLGYTAQDGLLHALPADTAGAMLRVAAAARVAAMGVALGTVKGKDIIPAPALAHTTALNGAAFPTVELGLAEALEFLHGAPVALPAGTVRGIIRLDFNNRPLGFVKNIGSRCNSLLPDNRRIRQAIPAQLPPLFAI